MSEHRPLLERQVSLIHYLTSGRAIFGEQGPRDPHLIGVNETLLRMEARFSYEKRIEKIAAVFPRTFKLLGTHRDALVREFVDACPPVDIARLANARQFGDFLSARWRRRPPQPPYLPDVAACEFACAQARAARNDALTPNDEVRPCVRRRPGVVLLRCAFDVQAIFETPAGDPMKRETLLAAVSTPDEREPAIVELAPESFDLLSVLEQWTDATAFEASAEAPQLLDDFVRAGLVEVCR
jgi:hypothetical protein